MMLLALLKQPSTILGLGAIAGVGAAFVAHLVSHDMTVSLALGGLAFGVVHILLPDNTGAPSSVEQLVNDAATAVAQQRLAAAMPQLMADTIAVIKSFTPAPPPSVTVPSVAVTTTTTTPPAQGI